MIIARVYSSFLHILHLKPTCGIFKSIRRSAETNRHWMSNPMCLRVHTTVSPVSTRYLVSYHSVGMLTDRCVCTAYTAVASIIYIGKHQTVGNESRTSYTKALSVTA
jgi:hypothetical protein